MKAHRCSNTASRPNWEDPLWLECWFTILSFSWSSDLVLLNLNSFNRIKSSVIRSCNYATIYYSYQEETNLLVNDAHLLLFYCRFIDDAFVIQRASPNGHAPFVNAMNDFGTPGAWLEWEATPPGREVDFLDLHIRLDPAGTISTTSFQKPMNLYLYCPLTSGQPSSILYRQIYGTLHRY